MTDDHTQRFLEESAELLTELEHSLLTLEESPDNQDAVARVFRALHTIKGSGAMFGFDQVAEFAHDVETTFELVRDDKLRVTTELVDLTLAARDHIRELLDAEDPGHPQLTERSRLLADSFGRLVVNQKSGREQMAGKGKPKPSGQLRESEKQVKQVASQLKATTYRIRFTPSRDLLLMGSKPHLILNELREMGECIVVAQMCDIPDLEAIDAEQCYIFWDVILCTTRGINEIRDVFMFVEDRCTLRIDVVDDGLTDSGEARQRIGEILVERGDITPQTLQRVLVEKKLLGEMLVDRELVPPGKVASALGEIELLDKMNREKKRREAVSSIRVPAEKLDRLVDTIGELVTVKARLLQSVRLRDFDALTSIAEEIERLTTELRDNSLTIRMLPIGTTFRNFVRIVRDLAAETGKEIRLTTEGGETELDKTIIEKLADPLVHIIRNAVDHGIEPPGERIAAGKSRQGTIHLSASHSGNSVVIRIADDGRGLDRAAIYERAVERGLLPTKAEIPDRQLFQCVLAPGFSTAKKVTEISGRGVGMDVVKRAVDSMRGTLEIESNFGAGTTFTVRLPLTLAIIESLLVRVGEERYILPLSFVNECIAIGHEEVDNANGMQLVNVRGSLVPYIHLRKLFDIAGDPPENQQVAIGSVNGISVGFLVDQVVGEHQSVIKSLGRMYQSISNISGATILGDGSVSLILNVENIVREELDRHLTLSTGKETGSC